MTHAVLPRTLFGFLLTAARVRLRNGLRLRHNLQRQLQWCIPGLRIAMLPKLISLKRALAALIIFSLSGLALWLIYLRYFEHREGRRSLRLDDPWTWLCEDSKCVKRLRSHVETRVPLSTCQMLCGMVPLWPYPTGTVRLGHSSSTFRLEQLALRVEEQVGVAVAHKLKEAFIIFQDNLRALTPARLARRQVSDVSEVVVTMSLSGKDNDPLQLTLATNESYRLVVSRVSESIRIRMYATSFFGLRHGLETLSQLAWWNGSSLQMLDDALVVDEPRFAFRGLMVDTARNFMSLASLKTTIDAMGACKLNAFHWHMSDSHSFPFDSPRVPNMSRYGAYSSEQVYTAEDVRELVEYALVRGVRIIPEIDAPAHAGNGWQWGPDAGLGDLSVCINMEPWDRYCGQPPCGQLNPDNNASYRVLGDIYRDLVELTSITDVFHLGGDEVYMECWQRELGSKEQEFVSYDQLMKKWEVFEGRALDELRDANEGVIPAAVIIWSSELTKRNLLDKNTFVVQVWGGSAWTDTTDLLAAQYRIIISHVDAWYLDCGLGDYRKNTEGPCGPLSTWQTVYQHRPWASLSQHDRELVLGGEACLWTERTDELALDSRLWPRSAALAERLWTDPDPELTSGPGLQPDGSNDRNLLQAYHRVSVMRNRLVARGVRADAVHPTWCHQNPTLCF